MMLPTGEQPMGLLRILGKVALLTVALPLALIAGLFFKGRKCGPEELASELRALAKGDMSYWDRLECVPLKDPRLEPIRQEALKVDLPFGPADPAKLMALADRAAALERQV
jgi:hypothetical protein